MEMILNLSDLYRLKAEIQPEFFNYLEQEFKDLYEYYSPEHDLENFILGQSQSMVILQTYEEVESILQKILEIGFVERIVEGELPFYRLGIRNAGEIQLFYCMEQKLDSSIIIKLREVCEYSNDSFSLIIGIFSYCGKIKMLFVLFFKKIKITSEEGLEGELDIVISE